MMKLTKLQIDKIQELGKTKSSYKIAKELHLTKPTVYYWLGNREKIKKNNIDRYRKKSKEQKKKDYEKHKNKVKK